MNTSQPRSSGDTRGAQGAEIMDMPLEVLVVPVSDADRAKAFYSRLGWRLDADRGRKGFRLVQFTPPGTNITTAPPGSAQGLLLAVSDIQAAREALAGQGTEAASMRSASARPTQTGPAGTPRTWWPSRPARSCPCER